jgi:diguanylate cyclase (GGDEF)-like protein/PAS domain S-box-containing protein
MAFSTYHLRIPDRHAILDAQREVACQRILRQAQRVLGVPFVFVTLTESAQHQATASVGLESHVLEGVHGFGLQALQGQDFVVISDAQDWPRLRSHPLVVGDPGVRFCAFRSFHTADRAITGTLCLFDTDPHGPWDAAQREDFDDFVLEIIDQLELRLALRRTLEVEHLLTGLNRELVRQRQVSELVMSTMSHGVVVTDDHGRIEFVNSAYLKMIGRQADTLIGQTGFGVIHPDDRETLIAARNTRLEGLTRSYEVRLAHNDGHYVSSLATVSPRLEDGERAGAVAVFVDLTQYQGVERALGKERNFVTAVLETAAALVIVLDLEGRIVRFNRACEDLTGWSLQEVHGRHYWEMLIAPDELEAVRETISSLQSGHYPNEFENHWLTRTGERRLIAWKNTCLLDESGAVEFVIGTGIDVTEQRLAETHLRQSESQNREVIAALEEGVVLQSSTGRVLSANASAQRMLGIKADRMLDPGGLDPRWRILQPDGSPMPPEARPATVALRTGKPQTNVILGIQRPGAAVRWVSVNARPLLPDSARQTKRATERRPYAVVTSFFDVSERKLIEERLAHQAHHDALTGLPNRVLFGTQLDLAVTQAQSNGQPFAVIFLDLDRFKTINDTHGHGMGDTLLRQVAERLQACVRQNDTVARISGDEFTILLPNLRSVEAASRLTCKIRETLEHPFLIDGEQLYISCSLGLAMYPDDGRNAEELLSNADSAMYQAKESGRNNVQFFNPQINDQAKERYGLEADLRQALERNEFSLRYQTQFGIASGLPVGLEALLRWTRPNQAVISPDRFIPLLEDLGLIVQVGSWVLRTACFDAVGQQQAGAGPLRIAVNVSAKQFASSEFTSSVAEALESSGLDPHLLELELTESAVVRDLDLAISRMTKLRELGVRLAMDDFGTGYSSLSHLRRLPVNVLKIDKAFVQHLGVNAADTALVRTIIALGHDLGMEVIAEGVETQSQLEVLGELHCGVAQGFLLARPVLLEEATRTLTRFLQAGQSDVDSY